MTFAKRLTALREAREFTQRELAIKTGMHPQNLNQLEMGVRINPTLETILILAESLKINPALFITNNQEEFEAGIVAMEIERD